MVYYASKVAISAKKFTFQRSPVNMPTLPSLLQIPLRMSSCVGKWYFPAIVQDLGERRLFKLGSCEKTGKFNGTSIFLIVQRQQLQ
jgi:hypothetical protein